MLSYSKIYPFSSDGAHRGSTSIASKSDHQMEKPSETDPALTAEAQRIWQPASAQPRPDHLPLGSPDPRAHPLYLGVASLTGELV